MHPRHTLLAAALALAIPSVANAGRFSWFDETPSRDSLGLARTPPSLFGQESRRAFGIDAFRSIAPGRSFDEDGGDVSYYGDTTLQFFGEVSSWPTDVSLSTAALHPEHAPDGAPNNRLSGFGIKLKHRVDASNTLSLSAGYSEVFSSGAGVQTPSNYDVLDTRAALSWTSRWGGSLRPGMTGSVFVGDESMREEAYQKLGRRYYGFSVGGELQVGQEHTPYFSYRLRRDLYNPEDPNYLTSPYEDRAQIAAGWKWQVQSNWSLQAEARYGLNGANLDPYSQERSHIFFGTRFDFR